jgi:hypothetical protein
MHDVCSVQRLPPTLISRFAAMGGRLPDTAVAVKERFRPRIQAVGGPQDPCLHCMGVFRGVIERLMQPVLWALAELAGLCSIAAVGVGLGLVHEDASEQDACPPPDTVRPLNDLIVFSQSVPALQKGAQTLVGEGNAAASSTIWAIFCPAGGWSIRSILSRTFASGGLFLVKNRNHSNNHPASRLSAHIVMKAAEGHCKHTVEYSQIHAYTVGFKHIHIIHTCTYALFVLRQFFTLVYSYIQHTSIYNLDTFQIHTHTWTYIQT